MNLINRHGLFEALYKPNRVNEKQGTPPPVLGVIIQ